MRKNRVRRVLIAVGEQSATENPYIALLVANLKTHLEVDYFTWPRALFGRYDVIHIHWPEAFIASRTRLVRFAKWVLAVMLILRLAMLRVAIVRTVHNEEPHDNLDFLASSLIDLCNKRTDEFIVLNPLTSSPCIARTTEIPHGHYRDWYPPVAPTGSRVPQRAILFGLLRSYKGIDELLDGLNASGDDDLFSLLICGRPDSPRLAQRLVDHSRRDPRVEIDLRYIDDNSLLGYLRNADLVVLPYRVLGNSGAALLALSLNRPLLLPRQNSSELLQSEFGEQYVYLYEPPITSGKIIRALRDIGKAPIRSAANMSRREWADLAIAHVSVYERARNRDVLGTRRS